MAVKDYSDEELSAQASKALHTRIKVTKSGAKNIAAYAKKNKRSIVTVFDEIANFLYSTNISPDEFWKIKDNVLIPKYHDFTAGFLQNFEATYLAHHQKFYSDVLVKITELERHNLYLTELINEVLIQNKMVVSGINYDEKEATDYLQKRDKIIEDIKQNYGIKQGALSLMLIGRVGVDAKIITSKDKKFGAVFTVAENLPSKETRWHNVQLWEDKLKDNTDVKLALSQFKAGDQVVLVGYNKTSKFIYKEGHEKAGQEGTSIDFIVSELKSHQKKSKQ